MHPPNAPPFQAKASIYLRSQLAGGLGFEPRLTESESAVLPLNYPPRTSTSSAGRLRHSSAAFCTARGQTLQEADPGWCDPSERPYSNELPLSPRPDLQLRRYTPGAWTAAVAERNGHSPLLRICEPVRSSRSFRGSLCPSIRSAAAGRPGGRHLDHGA